MADSDDLVFFSHAPDRLASFGLRIEMGDRFNGFHMLSAPGRHDLRVAVEMYREGEMIPVIEVVGHADEQGELRLQVRRVRG
jgi:hypothetical protein